MKSIFNLYLEKENLKEIEKENINGSIHPDTFYISNEKLNNI